MLYSVAVVLPHPSLYLFSSSSQTPQVWLLEGLGWSKIHLTGSDPHSPSVISQ